MCGFMYVRMDTALIRVFPMCLYVYTHMYEDICLCKHMSVGACIYVRDCGYVRVCVGVCG